MPGIRARLLFSRDVNTNKCALIMHFFYSAISKC